MQPLTLYSITEELRAVEEALIESGGEITPEMEERFGDLLRMEQSKVEGYLRMIRKFEVSAGAIEAEERRLAAARKTMCRAADRLKERLAFCMRERGATEYETAIGTVKLCRSSSQPVVLTVPAEELPDAYKRVKVEADLAAMRAALKSGAALEFAGLGEAGYYVRIY